MFAGAGPLTGKLDSLRGNLDLMIAEPGLQLCYAGGICLWKHIWSA
jgi:hypothetical protein